MLETSLDDSDDATNASTSAVEKCLARLDDRQLAQLYANTMQDNPGDPVIRQSIAQLEKRYSIGVEDAIDLARTLAAI